MTPKQNEIYRFIKKSGNVATRRQIVKEFSHWYWINADKYIGEILTRMVKNGSIERLKRGEYSIASLNPPFQQGMLFFV